MKTDGSRANPPDSPAAPGARAPRFTRWWAVVVLAALYFVAVLDRQLVALLVPQIKADLRLTDVQIGVLQGLAFAAAFTLGGIPIGWAVDRYSRRLVIFGGIVVWSLAGAASGLSSSFASLFVARSGVGAGEAALNPSAYSILAQTFPAGRLTLALSLFALGGNIGSAMSYILGGAFVNVLIHRPPLILPLLGVLPAWRAAFLLAGLPGILVGLLIFTIREPARAEVRRTEARSSQFRDLFARYARFPGFFLSHHIGFAIVTAAVVGLQAWNPSFMVRSYGWSIGKIGLWLGLGQLVPAIVGLLVHGAVVDWLYRRGMRDAHLTYMMAMCALAAPAAYFAYRCADPRLMLALYSLFYFCVMGFASIGPAALQIAVPPRLRGLATGFFMVGISFAGTAAGPYLVAALNEYGFKGARGPALSLSTFGCVCMVAAALVFALGRAGMRALATDPSSTTRSQTPRAASPLAM